MNTSVQDSTPQAPPPLDCQPPHHHTVLGGVATRRATAAPRVMHAQGSKDVRLSASRVPRTNATVSATGRPPIRVRPPLRRHSAYPLVQLSHLERLRGWGGGRARGGWGFRSSVLWNAHAELLWAVADIPGPVSSRQCPLLDLLRPDSFFAQSRLRARGRIQGQQGAGTTRCGLARVWPRVRGSSFCGLATRSGLSPYQIRGRRSPIADDTVRYRTGIVPGILNSSINKLLGFCIIMYSTRRVDPTGKRMGTESGRV